MKPSPDPPRRSLRGLTAVLVIVIAIAAVGPVSAVTNSARYRFEGNKWMSLDLAIAGVRADKIRFEWPATVLRVKTGYKATITLANDSTHQVGAGLALVLYDGDGRPVGAGTTGTTLGTIDPGDTAEFTIEFNHVTQRLERAEQFHLVLEIR